MSGFDPWRPILARFVLPLAARREGSRYLRHLQRLLETQFEDPEVTAERQWAKMTFLLRHAWENVPHYRRSFDAAGLNPKDVKGPADLLGVPLLSKEDVRAASGDLWAPGVDRSIPFLTSGSTGKPLRGWWSRESADWKRACALRSNLWAGWRPGERVYCLYGDPEREMTGMRRLRARLRRRLMQRTEVLDLLDISAESMLGFALRMRRFPPALLWGHAHGLALLASFLEQRGIMDLRPRGMYSAGMVLGRSQREQVERVFGCPLQDRYGCEELGLIAAECKACEGLHVNTDDLYVEFLDGDGRPVAPGERGEIVITDLSNLAMPFIRYRLEDVGVPSSRRCSCGRTQPLIERLEGRTADFLVAPGGRLVSGISLTDHFAGHVPGVAQMQIVQESLDSLTLNIVREPGFGAEGIEAIERLVAGFFGPGMRWRPEYVESIPMSRTGKFRFTVCKVEHDLL